MPFLFAILLFICPLVSLAKTTANLKNGVILEGYDPVSYFKADRPTKGKPELKVELDGIGYLFSSEENKREFLNSPDRYKPAYEGWCATAVVKGQKYQVDPLNYKITDGRLFLFFYESGLFGGDAKKPWVKNEPENIRKADANWSQVKVLEYKQ